jgi:hypothetical protein
MRGVCVFTGGFEIRFFSESFYSQSFIKSMSSFAPPQQQQAANLHQNQRQPPPASQNVSNVPNQNGGGGGGYQIPVQNMPPVNGQYYPFNVNMAQIPPYRGNNA